jgi:hypothetical protein
MHAGSIRTLLLLLGARDGGGRLAVHAAHMR